LFKLHISFDLTQTTSAKLERYLKEFEKLTPDEDYIIYNQTTPLEEWIKNNIK